jgi:hypothetical protein
VLRVRIGPPSSTRPPGSPRSTPWRFGLLAPPIWLAGLGADAAGYALQWVVPIGGSLVVVQPLLVSGLLFALPMRARISNYKMHRRDWAVVVLTTVGLAVFLAVSRPAFGHTNVRPLTWSLLLGSGAALLIAVGRETSPRWRSMAYGTAGGVVYGEVAALTKTCSHLLSLGVVNLLESWQLYVLIAAGAAGMVLAMSAFQAGPLDASLPALSATDPVVSVLIGAVAFGEALRIGPLHTTVEVLSLATMVAGIFLLGHTDAVKVAQQEHFAEARRRQAVS